jgi:hypothetical protein
MRADHLVAVGAVLMAGQSDAAGPSWWALAGEGMLCFGCLATQTAKYPPRRTAGASQSESTIQNISGVNPLKFLRFRAPEHAVHRGCPTLDHHRLRPRSLDVSNQ